MTKKHTFFVNVYKKCVFLYFTLLHPIVPWLTKCGFDAGVVNHL